MQLEMRTAYTPEQKSEALRLVAEFGKAEAGRRTGLPVGTIASWASRSGVRAPDVETLSAPIRAAALTMAQRRQRLAEGLMSDAERMRAQLFDVDAGALDQQRRASAIGTLVEKSMLLSGEATQRVDMSTNVEADRARAAAIVTQLAARRAS